MLRIVFMGTPEFAVPALKIVHENYEIVGVFTQPDRPVGRGLELRASPVKMKALEFGLPIFQPAKLSQAEEFERLRALSPDVIVVVAYGQILRKNVIDLPRFGCVNIHSSLLPRWRGAAPIQWAILAGDQETGISTMRIVEKLDAGPILLQKRTPITETETAQTLHDRLSEMGAELLIPTLQGICSGTLASQEQDESHVTYATKLEKDMELLDLNEPAVILDRRIRALTPWPGTSVKIHQRLKIKQVKVHENIQGPKGMIFERAGMVLLGTAQGSLELLSVQWEGKKEIRPAEFLNGLKGRGWSLPLQIEFPLL